MRLLKTLLAVTECCHNVTISALETLKPLWNKVVRDDGLEPPTYSV